MSKEHSKEGLPTDQLWDVLSRLPSMQRQAAVRVWLDVLRLNPRVALPTCGIVDDEDNEEHDHFYFGWNPGGRSLDISISPLGDVSWFFADHLAGLSVTSDEQPDDGYLGFVGMFPVPFKQHYRDGAIGVCGWCNAPLVNYNEICTCRRTGIRSQR